MRTTGHGATLDYRALDGTARSVMALGAIYDGLLGLLFLVAARPIMDALGVAIPDNPIYLQLAAGLIAVMGLYQFLAWREGVIATAGLTMLIAFKALYVLLALFAGINGNLPHVLFGVFAAVDLLFMLYFAALLRRA
jgi:hypothetical protein